MVHSTQRGEVRGEGTRNPYGQWLPHRLAATAGQTARNPDQYNPGMGSTGDAQRGRDHRLGSALQRCCFWRNSVTYFTQKPAYSNIGDDYKHADESQLYYMETYEKVHLWIGTTHRPEADYQRYFDLHYSAEGNFDDPNYKICGLCQDIGQVWYDDDFIGIVPPLETEVAVAEILAEAAIDAADLDAIKSICSTLGIEKANAVFWYADASLTIPVPYKENHNGLAFVGLFTGD